MIHKFTPYKYPIKLPNDDSRIIKNTKLINIIKLEKKPKKYNSFNIKRKISIEYFSEEMIKEDSKKIQKTNLMIKIQLMIQINLQNLRKTMIF